MELQPAKNCFRVIAVPTDKSQPYILFDNENFNIPTIIRQDASTMSKDGKKAVEELGEKLSKESPDGKWTKVPISDVSNIAKEMVNGNNQD